MEVFTFSGQEQLALKSLPKGRVLANHTSVNATSIYDLTIGRIFPDPNPAVERNPLISALRFSPETSSAMLEFRPRAYMKRDRVFEQWCAASIATNGEMEFIVHRLPRSSVSDRSGESFYSAAKTLFNIQRDKVNEGAAIVQSLKRENSDLYYVHCTEDLIPFSIRKLILPHNSYQAARQSNILALDKSQRIDLVAQCIDNDRCVSIQNNEKATIGALFDGAIPGIGYISQFSFICPGDSFGLGLKSNGIMQIFRKTDLELNNQQFLSSIVLHMFGEEGLGRYLSEYNLGSVSKHDIAREIQTLKNIPLTSLIIDDIVHINPDRLTFRARHFMPLIINGNIEDRMRIFS
jgi:hypothetical protein